MLSGWHMKPRPERLGAVSKSILVALSGARLSSQAARLARPRGREEAGVGSGFCLYNRMSTALRVLGSSSAYTISQWKYPSTHFFMAESPSLRDLVPWVSPPSGWILTVPQVGISEIESPHKAGEGVLCGAGFNLPLHGRQLHVLQARPLSLGVHSLSLCLQEVGLGLRAGSRLSSSEHSLINAKGWL